jgi:hypothetical protein
MPAVVSIKSNPNLYLGLAHNNPRVIEQTWLSVPDFAVDGIFWHYLKQLLCPK